jgi:dihydrofolate reductase
MAKVIGGITISLDGFVNDRDGGVGVLYPEFEALIASDMLQDAMKTTGAVVMGRNAYEMGQGDYSEYEYQVPIFVLTHQPPETVAKGENGNLSFTFVSDGAERAVAQAKAAAGDKDVMVIGGASTLRQCLNAGLLDEFQLGIAPILLGEGLPLFEQGMTPTRLEKVDTISLPGGRTDIIFHVVK